ncbi:hypothetical protein [Nocardia sp. NBC_00511]|uniref:hypothetical protein n=1 Tax=Nocardia sp. NBC_00511 TaxID=2903591 RepID=UPI0030E260EB
MGEIHRPGRPSDLPDAWVLWSRWAALALAGYDREAERRGAGRTGIWLNETGVHLDDCGSTWWTLAWLGQGRAVLFGEDDASEVRWYNYESERPAIDMLAGAPDWLPRADLAELDDMLGCVYWWDNAAWRRAPYPDDLADDGLECGISRFLDRDDLVHDMAADLEADDGHFAEVLALCDRLVDHAERGTLTAAVLTEFVSATICLGSPPFAEDDLPGMVAMANRAGLDTPPWSPTLVLQQELSPA